MAERNKITLWLLGYSALPTSLWALDPPYPMPFVWSWVVSLKVGFNWQSTQFWRRHCRSPDILSCLNSHCLAHTYPAPALPKAAGCLPSTWPPGWFWLAPLIFSLLPGDHCLLAADACVCPQSCFIYFCLRLPLFPEGSKHDLSTIAFASSPWAWSQNHNTPCSGWNSTLPYYVAHSTLKHSFKDCLTDVAAYLSVHMCAISKSFHVFNIT